MLWGWIKRLIFLSLLHLLVHNTHRLVTAQEDVTINGTVELCPPIEYFNNYTLTSQFQQFPVTWEAKTRGTGNNYYTIDTCRSETDCDSRNDNDTNPVDSYIEANSSHHSVLVFPTGWPYSWLSSNVLPPLDIYCNRVLVCSSMELYRKPFAVTCEFDLNGEEVDLTCTAFAIYPEGNCVLSPYDAYGWSFSLNTTQSSQGFLAWCTTTCRYRISVTSSVNGTYPLSVTVYPNIRNGTAFGVTSNVVYPNISNPVATLAKNCSDPSQFAVMSCSCTVPPDLFPPASPVWFTSSGQPVEDSITIVDKYEVVLNVTYKPHEPSQAFECRGNSTIGLQDPGLVFTPQFQFPNNQRMEFYVEDREKILNICLGITPVHVYCVLNDTPEAILYLDHLEDPTIPTIMAKGSIHHQFLPIVRSNISLMCRAENPVSRLVHGVKWLHLDVKEPPLFRPIITINDIAFNGTEADRMNVTGGDPFNVTCTVNGGVPEVSSVTLTCGTMTLTQPGKVVSISLDALTQKVDSCSCSAEQDGGCYNLSTEISIDIHEKGSIEGVNLYLNGGTEDVLTLCPGQEEPSVTCNVSLTGNLSDLVVLAYYEPGKPLTVLSNTTNALGDVSQYTFSLNQLVGGNHTVICQAKYTAFDSSTASRMDWISFAVYKPPPTPPRLKINGIEYSDHGQDAVATVPVGEPLKAACWVVGGYPNLTHMSLKCGQFASSTAGNVVPEQYFPVNTSLTRGQSCSCVAVHPSGCYADNTLTVDLDIRVPPKEYEIVVNKTVPGKSIVEPGSKIEISCDLSGNYSRNELVLISGFGSAKTLETSHNKTGISIQEATCESSGRYICPQSDYSENDQTSYVDILVTCGLKAPEQTSDNDMKDVDKPVEARADDSVQLPPIKLLGYPDPTVSINRENQGGESTPLTDTEYTYLSDRSEYAPPAVVVTVTLTDGQQKSGTNGGPPEGTSDYSVSLSNGEGQPYILKVQVIRSGDQSEEEKSVYLIAGVSLGCAIMAIFVGVMAVCWHRRMKLKKRQAAKERKMSYSILNPVFKDKSATDEGYAQVFPSGRISPSPSTDGRLSPPHDDIIDDILGPLPSISKHNIFDARPAPHSTGRRPSLPEPPASCENPIRRPSLPNLPLDGGILSLCSHSIPNAVNADPASSPFVISSESTSTSKNNCNALTTTPDGTYFTPLANSSIRKPSLPVTRDLRHLLTTSSNTSEAQRRPSVPAVFLKNPACLEKERRPSLPQNMTFITSAGFPIPHRALETGMSYLIPVAANHDSINLDTKPETMGRNVHGALQGGPDCGDVDEIPYQHVDPDYDTDDDGQDCDNINNNVYQHVDPDYNEDGDEEVKMICSQ